MSRGGLFGLGLVFTQLLAPVQAEEIKPTYSDGLRLAENDHSSFHFGGYLLFDTIPIDENQDAPSRFDLFNAWLHLIGTTHKYFYYKLQYSVETSSANKMRDAYFAFRPKSDFQIRFGQYVVPTLAAYQSAIIYTPTAGHSLPISLYPGRDVGIMLEGEQRQSWYYQAGILNGNGDDASGEENSDKDFALRVTGNLTPGPIKSSGIYPDLSFVYGRQNGDVIQLVSEGGTSIGNANINSIVQRWRLATGAYWIRNSNALRLESIVNYYDLASVAKNGELFGWSATFTHFITGESEAYQKGLFQKIKPNKPYQSGEGGGAWQLVARYSLLKVNSIMEQAMTSANLAADQINAVSIALNWLPFANARFNLTYIQNNYNRINATTSGLRKKEKQLIARFGLQFF